MTSTDKALSIKAWIIKQVLANPKKSVVLPLLVTLFVGMGINHIVIDKVYEVGKQNSEEGYIKIEPSEDFEFIAISVISLISVFV